MQICYGQENSKLIGTKCCLAQNRYFSSPTEEACCSEPALTSSTSEKLCCPGRNELFDNSCCAQDSITTDTVKKSKSCCGKAGLRQLADKVCYITANIYPENDQE